jgi:hypothetical protein
VAARSGAIPRARSTASELSFRRRATRDRSCLGQPRDLTRLAALAKAASREIALVHPVLAVAALCVGHALLSRAKGTQMAVDAHRTAGRGLLLALLLVLASSGVTSAPALL